MKIQNYKHIIWDWNGTLLDDAWLCVEIVNTMLTKRQLPTISQEQYQQFFTFPVRDYYLKIGFDFSIESFESISTEFIMTYEERRHQCYLREGVWQILDQITQQGPTQSILSAAQQSYLLKAIDEYKLDNVFTAVNGIDNHHASSKIEIGKAFMAQQEFGSKEALMIGDTIHDVEVAEAMGVDCCLIESGHQSYERISQCKVSIIKNFFELCQD